MLGCENLTLENDVMVVFRNLSFTALPGSLIIVHGPNGSGKSCFLKMITGMVCAGQGKIHWNKINIHEDICAFNSNTSYIGHSNSLKPELTVYENLKFWSILKGYKELLPIAISYFKLEEILQLKLALLSVGWQRRVELAKLLLSKSSLWLLDEPEVNLDAFAKELLFNLIKIKINQGGVVIIASHDFKNLSFANYINMLDFQDE